MDVIPFAQPALDGAEKRYVNEAMNAGWISGTGAFVSRFEEALAQIVGRKRCIAAANGTLALEVALQALGIGSGDEVIVPALTFVAPAAAVRRLGACPVMADIDPLTWTLDPESVRSVMSHNTKAIIAVDLIGNLANFEALDEFQLPIIEDAAEAHGAVRDGKQAGSWGIVSTFSFHPNKAFVMGEGGAVLTDWDWLANKIRLITSHGMDYPYFHSVVGTNARPNNLTCAVGLAQIERWSEHLQARKRVADCYQRHLEGIVDVHPQSSTWVVTITTPKRDRVLQALKQNAIDARAIFVPLPQLPIYAPFAPLKHYPVAEDIGATALFLPTYEALNEVQIERIVSVIAEAI